MMELPLTEIRKTGEGEHWQNPEFGFGLVTSEVPFRYPKGNVI